LGFADKVAVRRGDGVGGGGYGVGQAPCFADGRLFRGADDDGNSVFTGMQIRFGVGFKTPEHVVAFANQDSVEIYLAFGIDDLCKKPHGSQFEKLVWHPKPVFDSPVFSARPLGFEFIFAEVGIGKFSSLDKRRIDVARDLHGAYRPIGESDKLPFAGKMYDLHNLPP
jgi:hypothetical protein